MVDVQTASHVRWRLGVLAATVVVFVTFLPEIIFQINRGHDWNGSYACVDPDEMAYSAYLASIIAGKARLNNPYEGSARVAKENLFSTQFIPPYAGAFCARLFRISASTTFILLIPICAFASSLAIFWVISEVTGSDKISALGVLIVLLCGVVISEYPFTADKHYYTFAFLRRYIPAVPFPFFFLFCGFVWSAFTSKTKIYLLWSALAGICVPILIYSYFYLWTAALAWLVLFTLAWIIARPTERGRVLISSVVISLLALIALVPYFYLLGQRDQSNDTRHVLVLTHAPDLFRSTELAGLLILILFVSFSRRQSINWKTAPSIFALACAITPFIVFNQQIITGHSLQPFHFEQFIVNYIVLLGGVVTYHLIRKGKLRHTVLWVALALGIGIGTATASSTISGRMNAQRDEAISVYRLIAEQSTNGHTGTVLFDQPLLSAAAPTSVNMSVLWSPYNYVFDSGDQRERFFQYLYYTGVNTTQVEDRIRQEKLYQVALFGLPRTNTRLSRAFVPITDEEVRAEAHAYIKYAESFSESNAMRWPLSFVVLEEGRQYNLSNLDRWYERGEGSRTGQAIVYRVQLRQRNPQ